MMSLVQEKFFFLKKKNNPQPTEMQRSLCSHRHNKNEEEVDATKFTVGKRKLFFFFYLLKICYLLCCLKCRGYETKLFS